MSALALNNFIITGGGPISLPTKGTFSNNTMPFVLNYWPANSVGFPLVSRTALDINPPLSDVTTNRIDYSEKILASRFNYFYA